MIVIDCTVDDKDLTLEKLQEQFDNIQNRYYNSYMMNLIGVHGFPVIRVKMFPDEIWITQWQKDNIFTGKYLRGMDGGWDKFRDVPLIVKFKDLPTE